MPQVILYSKQLCQPCKATKRYLTKLGITYQEYNLDELPEKIEYMRANGFKSAPFIEVYKDNSLELEWCGFNPDLLSNLIK